MSEDNNHEELRPSKMRGVAFPKAKYGVILAIIVIIIRPLLRKNGIICRCKKVN